MGVLGSLFGGIYLASRGGGKKKEVAPPINAGSKDEEKFIQYVPRQPPRSNWPIGQLVS